MSITICVKHNAGSELGYDCNKGLNTPEATAAHQAEGHETTWVGCVVDTGEHNFYDDSDFYALVWDEERGEVREIEYASTRSWTYHNGASIDATPEVMAKVVSWKAKQFVEKMTADTIAYKAEPFTALDYGVEVRSLTTRGKNKGVVGKIDWMGVSKFSGKDTVGILVDGENTRRYLDADRVERTDLPEDMAAATRLTMAEIVEIGESAVHYAKQTYASTRKHYGV